MKNMNENFLARGKRADNDEWVYGYYAYYGYTDAMKHYIIPHYASTLYAREILPDTAGKYTGRKDANGTFIYEHDIIRAKCFGKNYAYRTDFYDYDYFVVRSVDFTFMLVNKTRQFYLEDALAFHIEVVGNEFDNPELLDCEKN